MPQGPDDYEVLPFAAGTSPFHIKGVAYQGHVAWADGFVPGGASAVADGFRDPALRTFFAQQFLAASWYDVFPMTAAWHRCAEMLQQQPNEFLRMRTRHQAMRDIPGVYKFILKIATAEAVALRVPRVVQRYFDFGSSEASVVGPGLVHVVVHGVPAPLVPWLRVVGETYIQVALELAGVTFAQLRRLPVTSGGEEHGVPLSEVGLEIQLDPTAG
jgi:hypothetical protein